jgi:hypothetical protein
MPGKINVHVGPFVTSVDRATHERLLNWGQWATERRGGGGGQVRSLEGRYRADPARPGAAGTARVDAREALAIERVVGDPGFPRSAAAMLRHQYVVGMDVRVSARVLGTPWTSYGAEFERAVTMAGNRLTAKWPRV